MKTTPRNICAHPDGYLVRIVRGDLRWSAFVPYSRPEALAEAIRLRNRFYKVCGKARIRTESKTARTNTDVVGISDTVHWKGVCPYRNFIVHAHGRNKRFYYGATTTREQAFNAAIAHRAHAIGKCPADLLPQF